MGNATVKYPSINGLRAISILMVIASHLSTKDHVFDKYQNNKWLMPFVDFFTDGQLGVNVFFVISGFLITSLMLQEEKRTNTVSLKSFYIRRTLRIFPAYYFLLLVYFILQLIGFIKLSGASWFTSVTYTKYFNWQADFISGHAWSLSIEEHFYLFWPLVFVYAPKARAKFTIAFILIVPVIRTAVHFHPISWIAQSTQTDPSCHFKLTP